MLHPAHGGVANAQPLTAAAVSTAIRDLLHSRLDSDLLPSDPIRHVAIGGGRVTVHLVLQLPGAAELAEIEAAVTEGIRALGASEVEVAIHRPAVSPSFSGTRAAHDPWAGRVRLGSARHVVAVGAGKGGVGKSTVAVNLALALSRDGLRIGLLDADIYGPSLPILLGVDDGAGRARMTPEKHIVPLEAYGIPFVSFGFFLGERSPAIWRGPMVAKAVKQFARGVAWPELDILVVDLPPGTGDVPLSLAQAIELSGAVIVTQPTRVASVEACKAGRMFASLGVPVLGIVENMTGVFGAGAGQVVARELEVQFLGSVPFDDVIIHEGEAGTPTVIARAGGPMSECFDRIARRVAGQLGWEHSAGMSDIGDIPSSCDQPSCAMHDAAAGAHNEQPRMTGAHQ